MKFKTEENKVTVSVVPTESFNDALEAKIEEIKESAANGDEYFCGFKAALEFSQGKAERLKCDLPTEVLPKEVISRLNGEEEA